MERFAVKLVNCGWRSYITCGLCVKCPGDTKKGCCHYSPTYLLPDLLYFFHYDKNFLDSLLAMDNLIIDDDSIRVESFCWDLLGTKCQFHSPQGCRVTPEQRDIICRLYICPGVGLWSEPVLAEWKRFFGQLTEDHLSLHNYLGNVLKQTGQSLKENVYEALKILGTLQLNLEAYQLQEIPTAAEYDLEITRRVDRGSPWQI